MHISPLSTPHAWPYSCAARECIVQDPQASSKHCVAYRVWAKAYEKVNQTKVVFCGSNCHTYNTACLIAIATLHSILAMPEPLLAISSEQQCVKQ